MLILEWYNMPFAVQLRGRWKRGLFTHGCYTVGIGEMSVNPLCPVRGTRL
jgi:hypothetical protein